MPLPPSTSPYLVTKTSTIRTPNIWDKVQQLTSIHFKTYLVGRNPFNFCTMKWCKLLSTAGLPNNHQHLLAMYISCSYTQELECLSRAGDSWHSSKIIRRSSFILLNEINHFRMTLMVSAPCLKVTKLLCLKPSQPN
jgi:hypothetical protein